MRQVLIEGEEHENIGDSGHPLGNRIMLPGKEREVAKHLKEIEGVLEE